MFMDDSFRKEIKDCLTTNSNHSSEEGFLPPNGNRQAETTHN